MKLIFSSRSWDQYLYWQENDSQMLARINGLMREIRRHPFTGTGKPEPLKNSLKGRWSRRISQKHRRIYRVIGKCDEQAIEIAACRFHYSD